MRVDALSKLMAVVFLCFAFVHICTKSSIATKSFFTATIIRADLVYAFRFNWTVMFANFAFVCIDTFTSLLYKALLTFTIIAALRIGTFRRGRTVVFSG